MELRFYTDADTELPHIYNHGVTEDEVETVLTSPGEDRPGRDGSRVAIGQTLGGRYLRVIYVPDDDGVGIFVVTSFPLKGKALESYKRRQKRRRR